MPKFEFTEALGPEFAEHDVWIARVAPLLAGWPDNVVRICAYAFTEMMNNANDHSGALSVAVEVEVGDSEVRIVIRDRGVGIFQHLVAKLGLDDERHAVFELTKGKLTTDASRHTGEGIFYTSRMVDKFLLTSGRICLGRITDRDWVLDDSAQLEGTVVGLTVRKSSTKTAQGVFDHYASEQEDYGFKKTTVAVALSVEGDTLVSRSQAKRVVARLDKFSEVALDFTGISSISPAFADEIFRVFQREHPTLRIFAINTNADVDKMITKARATTTTPDP